MDLTDNDIEDQFLAGTYDWCQCSETNDYGWNYKFVFTTDCTYFKNRIDTIMGQRKHCNRNG